MAATNPDMRRLEDASANIRARWKQMQQQNSRSDKLIKETRAEPIEK